MSTLKVGDVGTRDAAYATTHSFTLNRHAGRMRYCGQPVHRPSVREFAHGHSTLEPNSYTIAKDHGNSGDSAPGFSPSPISRQGRNPAERSRSRSRPPTT